MNLLTEPIGVSHYMIVGAVMFVSGAVCMATKRNALGVLMGIELVLNGANEATRLGARLAVVCSIEDADDLTGIRARMSDMTGGGVPADRMVLDYAPAGCTVDNCRTVTARIVGAQLTPHIPFFGIPFPIPEFPTSPPREYMNSAGNPVCPVAPGP